AALPMCRRHAGARRRGAHPRLLPLLVRGPLPGGPRPAEPGQAVRARLAHLPRLRLVEGLEHTAARAARRGGRPDPCPLRRGLRAPDRHELLRRPATGGAGVASTWTLLRGAPPRCAAEARASTRLSGASTRLLAQPARTSTAATASTTPTTSAPSVRVSAAVRHCVRSPVPRPRLSSAKAILVEERIASTSSAKSHRAIARGPSRAGVPSADGGRRSRWARV